jgi:hypothetical protein
MVNLWNVPNNHTITLAERIRLDPGDLTLPVLPETTSISVIAGKLPSGLRVEGLDIRGTPFEEATTTEYKIVFRASSPNGFTDRTIIFLVGDEDEPFWVTNPDLLAVGRGNSYFILDNEFIDYQLIAQDPDVSAGQPLEYYVRPGDGNLPPGIELTKEGRLVGVVEPLLALDKRAESGGWDTSPYDVYPSDFAIKSDNGWDSFFYDTFTFDFNYKAQTPKKLNRYYEFRVTVNDGYTQTPPQRIFRIYVVGDDFLRSDNSILKVSTGIFRADNTNVRQPVWLTPADLGYKRANNNIMIYLDVYDSNTLDGKVLYNLEDFNDDGTPSVIPPGTKIDTISGEIGGTIGYQPAITKEYKFTVNATRFSLDIDYAFVTGTIYEDVMSGNRSFQIYKLPLTVQDGITLNDGIEDLAVLRGLRLSIEGRSYQVEAVDGTNEDFDIITLTTPLESKIEFVVAEAQSLETYYVYAERINFIAAQNFIGKTLRFAPGNSGERYSVKQIIDYVEWEIRSPSSSIEINLAAADVSPLIGGLVESRPDKIRRVFKLNDDNTLDPWPVSVTAADADLIRFKAPKSLLTSEYKIKDIFVPASDGEDDLKFTLISDDLSVVKFNENFQNGRQWNVGQRVGLALFSDDFFEKSIVSTANTDITNPATAKTFSLKILGEVDSTIEWLSPADLGTITANFISTLRVVAATTVPDARLVYTLESGSLPNGLTLAYNGEIIGKVSQFGTLDNLGLTTFDSADFSLDDSSTSIDRRKRFTIKAADRFGYSAITQEFTVLINDEDDTLYSNLYMRPMLAPSMRDQYRRFISNPLIFPPNTIYRAADKNFGIQPTINMLAYAGIETKQIDEFVAATAKNHRRKQYQTGAVKVAKAKEPGTTDVVYEVVYLEVIDPQEPKQGKVSEFVVATPDPAITVDSVGIEAKDDSTAQDTGANTVPVDGRFRDQYVVVDGNESMTVRTRDGTPLQQLIDNDDIDITLRDGTTEVNIDVDISDAEPLRQRFRDTISNNVKADTDAVILNSSNELRYFISNITNMREKLEQVGKSQNKFLPLWMRTPQDNTIQELGYTLAIPLAYCKEGQAEQVKLNIQNALKKGEFDFKQLNLDIDRYVLDSAIGINEERYIVFHNYIFNV